MSSLFALLVSLGIPMGLALPPGSSPGQTGEGPPTYMLLLPYAIIFALFYFLLIAPARKKQQRTQEMLSGLKNGDRVVMNCGIYGTIVSISGDVVQLRIADKAKIEVTKSSIAGPVRDEEGR